MRTTSLQDPPPRARASKAPEAPTGPPRRLRRRQMRCWHLFLTHGAVRSPRSTGPRHPRRAARRTRPVARASGVVVAKPGMAGTFATTRLVSGPAGSVKVRAPRVRTTGMVQECRCQEVPRGNLGISRESGVRRHQARRIDGTPASRVHPEHHRKTAGKNAELPPQQGPGKCQAFPSGQHSPGALGPSNGSDRIGSFWLAHGGLSVRWYRGHVAGTSTPMSHQAGAGAREPRSASQCRRYARPALRDGGLAWSTSSS